MGKGRYFAWLLRIWQSGEQEAVWRASLEDPHTGERIGFANLPGLWAYVKQRITVAKAKHQPDQEGDES